MGRTRQKRRTKTRKPHRRRPVAEETFDPVALARELAAKSETRSEATGQVAAPTEPTAGKP